MGVLPGVRGSALLRCSERVSAYSHPRGMWPHGGGCFWRGGAAPRCPDPTGPCPAPRADPALRARRGEPAAPPPRSRDRLARVIVSLTVFRVLSQIMIR